MRLPWRKYEVDSDEGIILQDKIIKLDKRVAQLITVVDDVLDRYDQHHDKLIKRIDQRERRASKATSLPHLPCPYIKQCTLHPDRCGECKILEVV